MAVIGTAAAVLFFHGQSRLFAGFERELKACLYQDIQELYYPGVIYVAAGEEQTAAERVLSHFFMLESGTKRMEAYPTQVESDLSYEAILAREAADENYVDEETGTVVVNGLAPDLMDQASGGTTDPMGQTSGGTADLSAEASAPPGSSGTSAAGEAGQAGTQDPASDGSAAEGGSVPEGQDTAAASAAAGAAASVPAGSQPLVTYSREKLNDFDYLLQNFYQVDRTTTITSSQLNKDALLGKDVRLSHDASTPQILIYHTHSQEGYADSVPGDSSTSVVGVGDYLTQLLTEQYGFSVIHHKGAYDVGDRDHAYSNAGPALEQILAENPGIEVVIDLHRDGVGENTRLVTTQNGVPMAQIMFFNGLSRTTRMGDIDYLYNPYIADNLAMSFQMQLKAAEYYPGFTRRIYLKGYRYNMHYCPHTLLIEVGAQTNTFEEAKNAMVPLADLLNKVLTGAQ